MARIGAQNFTVSQVLTDVISGATTYDTPVSFAKKLMKIGIKSNATMVNLEADDQVVETVEGRGDVTIDIDLTEITEDERALLLGQTISSGVRTTNPATDTAPFFCVMWKSKKSNGKYKYYKILKTKFMEADEDFETKKQTPAFQTDKISGKGIARLSDGNDKKILDADSATYDSALASAWFTTGDIAGDVTPPTVTIVPTDGQAGVATSAVVVWTFNEAIRASQMTGANFFLTTAAGVAKAGTLSIGTNDTVVTFTPTTALAGATTYIAVATKNVTDLAGNALAANSVTDFATT